MLFVYVCEVVFKHILVGVLCFFLVFFVNNVLLFAQTLLTKHVSAADVVRLLLYSIPAALIYVTPFAVLVGSLLGLGRLRNNLELLALQVLGVSPRFLIFPLLSIGLCSALFVFVFSDVVVPASFIRLRQVYWRVLSSVPSLGFESHTTRKHNGVILSVGEVFHSVMYQLLIVDKSDSRSLKVVSSRKSVLESSADQTVPFTIRMHDPCMLIVYRTRPRICDLIYGGRADYHVHTQQTQPEYFMGLGPGGFSTCSLYREIQEKIKAKENPRHIATYQLEFQKKFSHPISVVLFIFLSFGLSTLSNISSQGKGFVGGLIVVLGYWIISIGGQELALRLSIVPSLALWIPNAAL